MGTFTESYESINFFQYLALFGLYLSLTGNNSDKSLVKSVWMVQKKITNISLVGISTFNIQSFLLRFDDYKIKSFDPVDPLKNEINNLMNFEKTFPFLMNNLKLNTMTWISRFDSDALVYNMRIPDNKQNQVNVVTSRVNLRMKFIMSGLSLANFLRRTVSNILDIHLNNSINITPELISYITTGIELIKVVEAQFYKILPKIAQSLNIMNRTLLEPIQQSLKKVQDLITRKFKEKSQQAALYKDQLAAAKILFSCSQAVPSAARLAIAKMCINTLSASNSMDQGSVNLISDNIWKLEILNNLSREIRRSCDCSFLYLYQDIIPTSLKSIYKNDPMSLYYYAMALNDMDKPLMYIKYKENNGFNIVRILRKNI